MGWGRTSRCGRTQLSPLLMIGPPVISDKQPHKKPESGEGGGYPRPEPPGSVRPLDAETTRLIVAVRIGVTRIRHVPFQFWLANGANKQITSCPECSRHERRSHALASSAHCRNGVGAEPGVLGRGLPLQRRHKARYEAED